MFRSPIARLHREPYMDRSQLLKCAVTWATIWSRDCCGHLPAVAGHTLPTGACMHYSFPLLSSSQDEYKISIIIYRCDISHSLLLSYFQSWHGMAWHAVDRRLLHEHRPLTNAHTQHASEVHVYMAVYMCIASDRFTACTSKVKATLLVPNWTTKLYCTFSTGCLYCRLHIFIF